jgi:hypothetical protein
MLTERRVLNRIAAVTFLVTLPLAAWVQNLVRSSDPLACPDALSMLAVGIASPTCTGVEHNISLDVLAAAAVATIAWYVARAFRARRASAETD